MDLGKFFLFKIRRAVLFLIPNLKRCKKVDTKSDKTKNFLFKIMLFTKTFLFKIMLFRRNFLFKIMLFRRNFLFKIMLFRKKFVFKIVLFRKIFFFKSVFFGIARKTQKLRNLRGKLSQNVVFLCAKLFSKSAFKKNFFFKNVLFKNLLFLRVARFKNRFFFKIDAS